MNTLKNANAIIIDDHTLFSESLSSILEKFNLFKVVYSLKNEEEVTNFYLNKNILDQSDTVVFLDYYMPEKNGLSILREIRRLDRKVKTIILSSVANPMVISEMLQAKPDAIVNKTEGVDQLMKALKHIENNKQYLSEFTQQIIDNQAHITNPLSQREIQILEQLSRGLSNEKVAESLFLSPLTINTHKRNMMRKTKCKSILELLAFARTNGLID